MKKTLLKIRKTYFLKTFAVLYVCIFSTPTVFGDDDITPFPGGSGEFTKLVWNDEFDVDGLPDPAKWSYEKGYVRNSELQYYTEARSENIKIENGLLKIFARNDNAVIDGQARDITSASIHTQYKGDWKYGRMEMRAKLPIAIRGNWPAFWMMPSDQTYGWWPKSGEIDIMEHVGYTPQAVFFAAHTQANNHASGGSWTKSWNDNTISTDFHIYAVEWFEDRIDWYFDNTKQFTIYNDGGGWESWPFNERFYIILNLAFGGGWGGAAGVEPEKLPAEYQVDYVRVFQSEDSTENPDDTSIIIADFEDASNLGTWANAGAVTRSIVDNPAKSQVNASNKVMQITKSADAESWVGVMKKNLNMPIGIETNEYQYLHLKMLKPVLSPISICLRTSSGVNENFFVKSNTLSNEWEYLIFDVKNVNSTPLAEFFIRPDYQKRAEEVTIYIDDIILSNSSTPVDNSSSIETTISEKQNFYINSMGQIVLSKEESGYIKIDLINMQGQIVENIYSGNANDGISSHQINSKSRGVYLIRITGNKSSVCKKVSLSL